MTDDSWVDDNNRYLEAELDLLRLRLLRMAPAETTAVEETSPITVVPVVPPARRRRHWLRPADVPVPASAPPIIRHAPAAGAPAVGDRELAEAIRRRDQAAAMDGESAAAILARQLGLSGFERDTLLLCAAMEFAPGLGALCARAQGNPAMSHPTFGLALSLFENPTWDAVSADRPLRYARLIEISQPGALPLTSSPLRADERIVSYLKGRNVLDDRLAAILEPAANLDRSSLAASQQAAVDGILRRLHRGAAGSVVPLVQLVGVDAEARLTEAVHVAAALSRSLYRLRIESMPSELAELETLARLWQRESALLPIALYIEAEHVEGAAADTTSALHRLLAHRLGLTFLGVRDAPVDLTAPSFATEVRKPTREEQRAAWAEELDPQVAVGEARVEDVASILAGQFNLGVGEIREAARMAADGPEAEIPQSDRLWTACRDLTRPRLDSLAQPLEAKATWSDLVLSDDSTDLLRQIAGQVRQRHQVYEDWGFARRMNRGLGISVLFAGESGTGKTMAAEVIANELSLDLYRIDLSAVVSKYIGETEKNLARLFDAAEVGGAILLFDEADALFGKRGEVRDSHDRYANIEINYLLQRIEAFTGLAILTTNMKSALDPAFMRRLRFVVNFQFPGIPEREVMWEKALPPQTPVAGLDYTRLARLTLTGGSIHSIALNAAFMAAENGQTVTMPKLLAAARIELRKLDKPFNEAEFR